MGERPFKGWGKVGFKVVLKTIMNESGTSPLAKAPRITQREVAQAANVSQSLVSMVLNGDGGEASEEIRNRILQAARDLQYTPLRRRSNRKDRKLFAFIRPQVTRGHHQEEWIYDSYEQFYLDIQEQFRLALQRSGYSLITHDDSDVEETKQWLEKWDVAGVFINSLHLELIDWIKERIPVVEVTRMTDRSIDCVTSDDFERVALAFDYLYERGHRSIAYVRSSGQAGREIYDFAYERRCKAGGILPESIEICDFTDSLAALAQRFLESEDRPSALIGDPIKLLILQKHFMRLGVSVPDDVSLISIDNISACRFLEPSLVSIDLNFPAFAENALRMMQARLEDPMRARCKIEVLPSIIPGNSVGKPHVSVHPQHSIIL